MRARCSMSAYPARPGANSATALAISAGSPPGVPSRKTRDTGTATAAITPAASPVTSSTIRVVEEVRALNPGRSPSSARVDSTGKELVAIGITSTAYGSWYSAQA